LKRPLGGQVAPGPVVAGIGNRGDTPRLRRSVGDGQLRQPSALFASVLLVDEQGTSAAVMLHGHLCQLGKSGLPFILLALDFCRRRRLAENQRASSDWRYSIAPLLSAFPLSGASSFSLGP
jgi:hypothetical protein